MAAAGATAAPPADAASVQAGTAGRSLETRQQTMRRVVRTWSRLLNAGDNAGIARLFRVPAIFAQQGMAYRLTTAAQVVMWHEGLPCAGRVTSIRITGTFATVVFVLGNRKGSKCDAPGQQAAARFKIVRGKIVVWEQVPVPVEPAPAGPKA